MGENDLELVNLGYGVRKYERNVTDVFKKSTNQRTGKFE